MDAYSEDLRKKIVNAVEQRGMGQSEAARTFDVSLSSVKRHIRKFRQGRSLSPGKAPGKLRHPANVPSSTSQLGGYSN
jgi:transposase